MPVSRASENSLGNRRHLASECLKQSRAQKPIQQKEALSGFELESRASEYTHSTAEPRFHVNNALFFVNWTTTKICVKCWRSAQTLALSLTVKIWLGDTNELCWQGLDLSSTKDSALNHYLALLQSVMNAVGNHWGSASHVVKHKHSGINDWSVYIIRMAFRKYHDMFW